MKQKFIELLNAKFLGKGIRKDVLARLASAYSLQATTEEEAQAFVEKLTEEQVTDFQKEHRSDIDSEISKATKTALEKVSKNKEQENNESKVEEEPGDISKIIAKAVADATTPLMEKINAIESGKISETRLSQINNILKDAKDESLKNTISKSFDRMSFENDEAFTEYLTEVQTNVNQSNQSIINQGLTNHRPLSGGTGNSGSLSESDYQDLV